MAKAKHPGGAPTKYKKEYAEQAKRICQKYAPTDIELSYIFGVAESTIYKWKKDHAEFSEAIKDGKLTPIEKVELSLFEKANGYSHPETKTFVIDGEIVTKEITKHYPPSDKAMIYYLNNLAPEKYRNQPTVIIPGDKEAYDKLLELYGHK